MLQRVQESFFDEIQKIAAGMARSAPVPGAPTPPATGTAPPLPSMQPPTMAAPAMPMVGSTATGTAATRPGLMGKR